VTLLFSNAVAARLCGLPIKPADRSKGSVVTPDMQEKGNERPAKGEPWSRTDIVDLEDGIVSKDPVPELARFLHRSEEEVRNKARELGHGELPESAVVKS
jgi:hypothetical protein